MIYKIVGTVEQIDENTVSVSTDAGVGFEVICTQADAISLASEKGNQTVFTYLQVREDAMVLYGFKSLEVKAMFLKLITISGIGPKMAISILSETTPEDLSYSIVNSDVKALSKVKGLGKKTAERIILELKEKVSAIATDIKKTNKTATVETGKLSSEQEDSLIALCSLGLGKTQATKLVMELSTPDMKAEDIVAICIKNMGAR
ncbi:MAG: Holliday junction branch migration protein RuvA [Clostridia bacterium]|nr:Holliday junction branch migration protein RuvA [Clostridia bacterium]